VFSLNIRAPFLCAQAAFGLLRERGGAESRAPLGHIGDPADVAGAVVFLAEAQFITGEVLRVDGGTHLRRVY
jgi:NAD(P)-dependent dehydrogenase (short-subunit alcohol dehydrogenase family)